MKVYCKKCGIRGDSKCPHCRNVFPNRLSPAQQALEQMIHVRKVTSERSGIVSTEVYFLEFDQPDDEVAMDNVLSTLEACFSVGVNIKVASCVHKWELMPGVSSSIDCGHSGPYDVTVPPDPFEKEA